MMRLDLQHWQRQRRRSWLNLPYFLKRRSGWGVPRQIAGRFMTVNKMDMLAESVLQRQKAACPFLLFYKKVLDTGMMP